ncbi:MAG: hypothetical protein HC890_16145 [Chloroflexaceae bacterium]|nr:hypothetical protein [Chloroflexaceae bacterium]
MGSATPVVLLCPGFHPPHLTQGFLQGLTAIASLDCSSWLILPSPIAPVSAPEIATYLATVVEINLTPVIFIGYSAGAVGAIAAAQLWQQQGGTVRALLAIDGWGVPLIGNFPSHRLSHDPFTHWSSALLGPGADSFYAEPGVSHWDLFQFPDLASGWWIKGPGCRIACTAAQFLATHLSHYLAEGNST